jgi:hypothetical protein
MSTDAGKFMFKVMCACVLGITLYATLLHWSEQQRERDISIYHLEQVKERLHEDTPWKRIIMGDSRTLAVNYTLETPSDIYNFAFSNTGGMYPYVYVLKKYLQHHPPPEEIYWSFIPLMLTDTWEIFKNPPPLNAGEMYRAARLYRLTDILLPDTGYAVFRKYPHTSVGIIRDKFNINPDDVIRYFSDEGPKANFNGLYNPLSGGLLFDTRHEWEYTPHNYLEETPFVISAQEVEFMRGFLSLAEKHNIKVHYFNMPIPEPVFAKRMQLGFYTKFFAILEQMQNEFPATFSYTKKVPAYACRYFIDGSHLNAAGALKLEEEFPHLR